MQHIEQHREQHRTQHRTENTEQHTEQRTQNSTQNREHRTAQRTLAHNYRTYSFDFYFEFAYIKNSNTIEIYTILQDNVQKTLISSLYSFDFIV